jgi:signal transduction histidine kinase
LSAEPQALVVSVQDNGIGIAPENQHRLFEKFYRIRRRDTVHIRGTGLGLAIVKSISDLHGGRVWVESKLDEGSTFYLALPLLPVTQEPVPEGDPVGSQPGEPST